MSRPISDRTQRYLCESLPLVRQHKQLLIDLVEVALRNTATQDDQPGQSEVAAMILVQMLLDQASLLAAGQDLSHLRDMEAEHRALGISGRHYSRFGDVLIPLLRDILGPSLPEGVTSAWCDTFWAIIRAAEDRKEEVSA